MLSGSEEETIRFGRRLGASLRSRAVVALIGPLGAGKTRLASGIARGAGYAGRVRSPTFALLHVYRGVMPVRHFDFYRLDTLDEGTAGEWEELFEQEGLSLIEWADRIPGLVTSDSITIEMRPQGDLGRWIRMRVGLPTRVIGDWRLA
jgi:tRNA threonylcarbamoyladenosine biosynthesis protein TsaE